MVLIKKIPKGGMAELQVREIYKKLRTQEIRKKYVKYNAKIRKRYIPGDGFKPLKWNKNKGLQEYNYIFKSLFKEKNLIEFINANFKHKKLRIMDEGLGEGKFLQEIKKELQSKYIVETTGITIDPSDTKLSSTKNIDHIIVNPIERMKYENGTKSIVPDKKQDLIFSTYGGFQYTLDELKKNVLLKTAYSLNKEGCAFITFTKTDLTLTEPFDYLRTIIFRKKLNKFYDEVKVAFKKRGFQFEHQFDSKILTEKIFIKRL